MMETVIDRIRNRVTELNPGDRLRVLSVASRKTTVLQYSTAGVMKALASLGCATHVLLVDGDDNDPVRLLAALDVFNPHVIFTVNFSLANINPSVWRVSWWQDYMPCLNEQLPWGEREVVYAVPSLIEHLRSSGCPNPMEQTPCVDLDVFVPGETRRRMIVSVASNYIEPMDALSHKLAAVALAEMMDRGWIIRRDVLQAVADSSGLSMHEIWWVVWPTVVRRKTVEWLLQCRDLIDVEIYGSNWGIPGVEAVSHDWLPSIYGNAEYALVSHGWAINTQRLAEVSACGSIPVIYDVRALATGATWDDCCLWFRSLDTLRDCLSQRPTANTYAIADASSYRSFAARILADIDIHDVNR